MKTIVLKLNLLIIFVLLSFALNAKFVTPLTTISGTAEVTTLDGKVISGKVKFASFGPNGMMSFTLLDEEGNKNKYKAADVQQLKLKVDGLARLEITAEQSSNIEKLAIPILRKLLRENLFIGKELNRLEKINILSCNY